MLSKLASDTICLGHRETLLITPVSYLTRTARGRRMVKADDSIPHLRSLHSWRTLYAEQGSVALGSGWSDLPAPQEKFQGRRLKLIGRIGNWKVYVGETSQKSNNVRGPDVGFVGFSASNTPRKPSLLLRPPKQQNGTIYYTSRPEIEPSLVS